MYVDIKAQIVVQGNVKRGTFFETKCLLVHPPFNKKT